MKANKMNSKKRMKYTGYASVMMIGLISVLLLINYFVTSLDERHDLSADMTANRIYSLSGTTKDILSALDEDIFIYTTEIAGIEDANVEELLKNYSASSHYIHVVNIDIVKNPATIDYYNDFSSYTVTAGNIIVSNSPDTNDAGQKYEILDYSELYSYNAETEIYDEFSAEDAITRAIKHVIKPNDQKVWLLDNHSEDNASNYAIKEILEYGNYQVEFLNLLNGQNTLDADDILIIIDMQSDLTAIESDIINDFLDNGGRMMIGVEPNVIASTDLTNVLSLVERYNIKINDGLIMETDLDNIAVTSDSEYMYSFIIPKIAEHEITNDFLLGNYKLLLGMNVGYMIIPDKINNPDVSIAPLLLTSQSSFLEPWGDDMDNEANADALYGEFVVMTAIIEKNESQDVKDTKMIVLCAPELFTYAGVYSRSVYKNEDFLLKTISWLADDEDEFYISGKSLVDSPLMIETMRQAYFIIALVCVVIPLIIFAAGIIIFIKRKNL